MRSEVKDSTEHAKLTVLTSYSCALHIRSEKETVPRSDIESASHKTANFRQYALSQKPEAVLRITIWRPLFPVGARF